MCLCHARLVVAGCVSRGVCNRRKISFRFLVSQMRVNPGVHDVKVVQGSKWFALFEVNSLKFQICNITGIVNNHLMMTKFFIKRMACFWPSKSIAGEGICFVPFKSWSKSFRLYSVQKENGRRYVQALECMCDQW